MKKIYENHCFIKQWPKIFLTMKLVFVFILAGFLSVNATETYSQNVRFDLKMENVSFKSILNKIEEKTDFNFIYQNDEIKNMSKLSVNVDHVTVPEILDRLLKDKGLEYKIYDHYVLIQKTGANETVTNFVQQQKTVSGKVTDSEGQALPGVTIVIKGTTQGVISDINGKYTFSNIPANATLQFSFVGMKSQEIVVDGQTTINVQMIVDAIGLDEVVAIGYGTAKKKDLSGSIVNVNIKELEKYKPANVQEFLRSSVSGLRIGYSTDAKNSPSLEIRGDNTIKSGSSDETTANSPLIVLDGVIFNGDLSEININDIESVDVLKDASAAAIYGSRSSNGVIVFNTKKGDMGAPVVRVNVKYGIITGANRLSSHKAGNDVTGWLTDMNEAINDLSGAPFSVYDNYYDLADEFKSDWLSEKGISGETDPTAITSAWIDGFGFDETEKENFLAGRSFDWQDFLFHIGLKQDYNVSFSGRTNKVSYYWSLGYIENESTQMNDKFTTLTSRVNLDVNPAKWLNVGLNCNFAFQDEGDVPISNSNYYEYSPYDSPWENEVWYDDSEIEDTDSYPWRFPNEYLRESQSGSNRSNPYLNAAYTDRKYNRYKLFPTIYAKFSLPFGVKLTSRMTTRMDFYNKYLFYDDDNPSWSESSASRNHSIIFEWQWDNILSWNKIFGKHSFNVTGLINSEDAKAWSTTSGTTDFSPTDALGYHGMGLGMTSSASSTDTDVSRDAIMGRINYGYDGRYNISASIRRDGCSKFGSNNKRATFPSFSAAWNITKEEFMLGKPEWLSFLKLRTSWGMNGNSAGIDDYQSYAVLASKKYLTYDDGYINTAYTYIDAFADPDLEWEKTASWNFGIDYGLWDGRIRGAVDIYNSKITDLLLEKSLPIINGLTSTTTNVGSLKNKGIDLSISTVNIESSFLKWNSQLNISWNKNKIISLTGEEYEVTDENGNTYMKEYDDTDNGWFIGKSKDVIFDYKNDGVYQEGEEDEALIYGLHPGDFKIVDQNNDGVLNSDDKVFQGVSNNPWYITLRNDVEYKNFDFGIIFLAKLGYKGGSNLPFNNAEDYIKNHNWYDIPYWTEDNPINNAARINSTNTVGANIWRNKSYIRCQNITLGYNFVPYLLRSLNINSARLAFNIDNAFILTDWAYGDPESMFEMPRTYSLNLNFSF